MSDIGPCWVCGEERELTAEHFPPRSAFNDSRILEMSINERTKEIGQVAWGSRVHERGAFVRSLCASCNSMFGNKYDQHYGRFVMELAQRADRAPLGATIDAQAEYPLRILKAIVKCFVSANGKVFVDAHPWLRHFLLDPKSQAWPDGIYLYAYACGTKTGRQTGMASRLNFFTGDIKVISEFAFWPLGSVFSFARMDGLPLTPIHHWANRFRYKDKGPDTVRLHVNAVATPSPLDFRPPGQVSRDAEGGSRSTRVGDG